MTEEGGNYGAHVCAFCGNAYSYSDGERPRPGSVCADCWPKIQEIEESAVICENRVRRANGKTAWSEKRCPRCGDRLGKWHFSGFHAEFYGCHACGYGVTFDEDGRYVDEAADLLHALLKN